MRKTKSGAISAPKNCVFPCQTTIHYTAKSAARQSDKATKCAAFRPCISGSANYFCTPLTKSEIGKAVKNLLRGRTSFVIAHRLSTVTDADLILYMEEGNIVESGSHEALLEKGGHYAALYNSQFS